MIRGDRDLGGPTPPLVLKNDLIRACDSLFACGARFNQRGPHSDPLVGSFTVGTMLTGVEKVVELSPTTRSFKDYFTEEAHADAVWGIPFQESNAGRLLDLDRPSSAAMFDLERAKEIEFQAFRELMFELRAMLLKQEGAPSDMKEQTRRYLERKRPLQRTPTAIMARANAWNDEYQSLYQECLSSLEKRVNLIEQYDIHEAGWIPQHYHPGVMHVTKDSNVHTRSIVKEDQEAFIQSRPWAKFITWANVTKIAGVDMRDRDGFTIENPTGCWFVFGGPPPSRELVVPYTWIVVPGEIEVEGESFTAGIVIETERCRAYPDKLIREDAPGVRFDSSIQNRHLSFNENRQLVDEDGKNVEGIINKIHLD